MAIGYIVGIVVGALGGCIFWQLGFVAAWIVRHEQELLKIFCNIKIFLYLCNIKQGKEVPTLLNVKPIKF